MNEETNENELNNTNLDNGETTQNNNQNNNVENAFSDLISEYFEEGTTTENAGNIQAGAVLDWDSVANGQLATNTNNIELINLNNIEAEPVNLDNIETTNTETIGTVNLENIETTTTEAIGTENTGNTTGILYNNLETVGGEVEQPQEATNIGLYENLQPTNNLDNNVQNAVTGVYTEIGNVTNSSGTIKNNVYGTVTTGETLTGGGVNININVNKNTQNLDTTNVDGTSFKLTQGNLPAKIGFWTKVRNFFMADSKISYSVGEQTQQNTGLWNKVQNFFSFGKNK